MVTKKALVDHITRKSYGYYFITVFMVCLIILALAYGSFLYFGLNKSLPRLQLFSENVGYKTEAELSKIINSISEKQQNKIVQIEFEGDLKVKNFSELGISVDKTKTVDKVMKYGKTKNIFPNFSYFKNTLINPVDVSPKILWKMDAQKNFSDLFQDKKTDSKNPSLNLDGNEIKVEPEQEGYAPDYGKMMKEVEKCFISSCKDKIVASKVSIKPNVTKGDIEHYIPQISDFIGIKFVFKTDYKNIYPTKADLLGLVDIERTVLSQNVSFSDQAISDYLDSVSSKINTKGSKKIISSVDNTVISEGKEAQELDITKSKESVKKALENQTRTIELAVVTKPIEEETFTPGNNPGKYPGKYIEVNLSEQTLYLFDGSTPQGTFKVSTGKWSMPTPEGEYSINNKDPRAYSREYNLYMPYWMSFIGSQYGIHELPEWPDGTKEGEGHLGTPVSHGCIRLGRGAAEQVYNWADIGTTVFIHR
ncbi:MAG: L,D-transpeptidase family protein [Candidatus Berkelbacteria bacterium]|nr:L,D-transpeptidase family protein [Candidatus Berkelbacteria bacterium]